MKNKTGTKEWSSHSVNSQIGCKHDCRYCYMKAMDKRFNIHPTGNYKEEFETPAKIRKCGGIIMYPTRHDIHLGNYKRCIDVIIQLLNMGNKVLVVSKMSPQVADQYTLDLLGHPNLGNLETRITITAEDEGMERHFEPNAPYSAMRMSAVRLLWFRDFKVSLSMEPMLCYPHYIIEKMQEFVSEIWLGCLTKYKLNPDNPFEKDILELYQPAQLVAIYEKFKNNPKIKFKESFVRRIK